MGEPLDPGPDPGRERAVTTALTYALLLVVVAILVTGLFVGVGTFVENQRERAIGSQMESVGDRLAADITTADRLVRTANTSTASTVRLRSRLPESVGGSQYLITIESLGGNRSKITLRSTEPEVVAFVVVRSTVGLKQDTVQGGRLSITYDDPDAPDDENEPADTDAELEVRSTDG